ncbi:MAG: hypothetical protein AAF687_05755, partial [Pseudomonadota bacterium]
MPPRRGQKFVRTGITMKSFSAITAIAALLAVSACSGAEEPTGDQAEDFAARIGSNDGKDQPVAQGTVAPTMQEEKPGAAPGPFTPGTQTDPDSACGANLVGEFIGQQADDATRVAVQKAATGASEVRFIGAGNSTFINPDPTNPRLNLMLDANQIIRDARCG